MQTRERQQHLDRSQMELLDQHGRKWVVVTEVGLDFHRRPKIAPVGSFTPLFTPPYDFLPPQKYLVYDHRRPSHLTIAYRPWIADVRQAHKEIDDQLKRLAWMIYRDQAPKFIKEPTPEMLEIVYGHGKGPEPWEPILAAMQGNGWILGLRPFDPDREQDVKLRPYLERWVEVRYRDAKLFDEEEAAPEALQFGDPEAENAEAEMAVVGEDEED